MKVDCEVGRGFFVEGMGPRIRFLHQGMAGSHRNPSPVWTLFCVSNKLLSELKGECSHQEPGSHFKFNNNSYDTAPPRGGFLPTQATPTLENIPGCFRQHACRHAIKNPYPYPGSSQWSPNRLAGGDVVAAAVPARRAAAAGRVVRPGPRAGGPDGEGGEQHADQQDGEAEGQQGRGRGDGEVDVRKLREFREIWEIHKFWKVCDNMHRDRATQKFSGESGMDQAGVASCHGVNASHTGSFSLAP